MIPVPESFHRGLQRPLQVLGDEIVRSAALALVPTVILQRLVEDTLTNLPVGPFVALRSTLVLALGAGALMRALGSGRRPDLAPLERLEALAVEVREAAADHERRRAAFVPDAHDAGRRRLAALAEHVAREIEEAGSAMAHERPPRVVVRHADLRVVLVENEEGVIAPSPIRIPGVVREALERAEPWSGRRSAISFLLRMSASLTTRMLRWGLLLVAVGADLAGLAFDPSGSDLGLGLLLVAIGVEAVRPEAWTERLAVGVDPRLPLIEACASAVRYGDGGLAEEELGQERELRLRVLDAVAALGDLGPLGAVDSRTWEAWTDRKRI